MASTSDDILNMTYEERCARGKLLVQVDFDGVLHSYSRGLHDGTIYDNPYPGAVEWFNELFNHFDVIVLTARAKTSIDIIGIREWMRAHGMKDCPITNVKQPAFYTLDDRCVQFTGEFPSVHDIKMFKPYNGVGWK